MKESCKTVIVIPLYKPNPEESEIFSLNRCIQIFGNRTIAFVYPKNMCLTKYMDIYHEAGVSQPPMLISLAEKYFNGILGYNDLCLSSFFYDIFIDFEYMLIYQLDAYVFYDNIDEFIAAKIDYIGAPCFDGYRAATELKYIGLMNGGFSLRNIKKCKEACRNCMHFRSVIKLYKTKFFGKRDVIKFILYKLKFLSHKPFHWEDMFFSLAAPTIVEHFQVASYHMALRFSWDCLPELLYEKHERQLPMGCHKFTDEKTKSFWDRVIY